MTDFPFNSNLPTRWYEQSPRVAQAVEKLENMPDKIRIIICKMLNVWVEDSGVLKSKEDRGLKQLGKEKVTAFMKSKNKRRWYDHNLMTHKAFNAMYLMSEPDRLVAAEKILAAIEFMDMFYFSLLDSGVQAEHVDYAALERNLMAKLLAKTYYSDQFRSRSGANQASWLDASVDAGYPGDIPE